MNSDQVGGSYERGSHYLCLIPLLKPSSPLGLCVAAKYVYVSAYINVAAQNGRIVIKI